MNIQYVAKSVLRVRPSALFCAIIVAVSILVWGETLVDPERVRGMRLVDVLAHERDDHGKMLWSVANLPADRGARLYMIGGSALREAYPAERIVEKLFKQNQLSYQVANLSSFDQTLFETLLLVRNLKLVQEDVVAISLNPGRLTGSYEEAVGHYLQSRIPLLQDDLLGKLLGEFRQEHFPGSFQLWRQRLALKNFVLGHLSLEVKTAIRDIVRLQCEDLCLNRALARWWRKPRRYLQYAYPNYATSNVEKTLALNTIKQTRLDEIEKNKLFTVFLLKKIVDYVSSANATIIFLDLPRDPLAYTVGAKIENAYLALLQHFKHRAIHFDMKDTIAYPSIAFYDLFHLRAGWRTSLARKFIKKTLSLNGGERNDHNKITNKR